MIIQFLLLLYLPLLWFLLRAVRHPRDAALWMIVTCLVLRTVDGPWVMPTVRKLVNPDAARWVFDSALTGSWTALLLFFVLAAGGSARRVRAEVAVWATVSIAVAVCIAVTPGWWAVPDLLAQPHHPGTVVVETAVVDLYYVYVTGSCALWALRYAAESQRRLRPGLWLAAAGLGTFALASAAALAIDVRLLPPSLYEPVIYQVLGFAVVAFAAGVCVVGLVGRGVALRVWWRHHQRARALWPLWSALHAAYPDDALDRAGRPWWIDRLLPRQTHRRYWRRRVEIRDGLVQLSPHLSDAGYDPDQPAHQQVAAFRDALGRVAANRQVTASRAVPVAVPGPGSTEDADVAELIQLSDALASDEARTVVRNNGASSR